MRKHKIKLSIKSDRELLKLHKCANCKAEVPYKELCFYVDESNISITNNSPGFCMSCYLEIYKYVSIRKQIIKDAHTIMSENVNFKVTVEYTLPNMIDVLTLSKMYNNDLTAAYNAIVEDNESPEGFASERKIIKVEIANG